jgi:hypothetical protein
LEIGDVGFERLVGFDEGGVVGDEFGEVRVDYFRRVVWLVRMAEVSLDVGAEEWEEVVDDDEEVWWERGGAKFACRCRGGRVQLGLRLRRSLLIVMGLCGWWGLCAGGISDTMP